MLGVEIIWTNNVHLPHAATGQQEAQGEGGWLANPLNLHYNLVHFEKYYYS